MSTQNANPQGSLERVVRALEEIRETAMQHPCFWREAFDDRDVDAICKEGGDICDWTMLAITADDALRPNDQAERQEERRR